MTKVQKTLYAAIFVVGIGLISYGGLMLDRIEGRGIAPSQIMAAN